jgi:molybdenum cofactor cytidylyltransferase
MIAAVVLAAGESRRMGRLKPLIKLADKTFLQHITEQCRSASVHKVHIVVGFEAEKIIRESGCDAVFVRNKNYRQGQFCSLQRGIDSLDKSCRAAVVCLGDQPHIRSVWIEKLIGEFERTGAGIVIPRCKNRQGHPVLYSRRIFQTILSLNPSHTAREVTNRHTGEVHHVEINDDGILADADTGEDLEVIATRIPHESRQE